jgi:hypothetical protein
MASWGPDSHGWQLGIISANSRFAVGQPISIVVLVRNSGAGMGIHPLEPWGFETQLVDSHDSVVAGRDESMNSTGLNEFNVGTNSIVKNALDIGWRYNLVPGTYRLRASTDIIQGSTMQGAHDKSVFVAHITSGTITITILP